MMTTTKERPIILRSDEAAQIIDGRLTTLKRPIKPRPPWIEDVRKMSGSDYGLFTDHHFPPDVWRVAGPVWAVRKLIGITQWRCPFGTAGDRLWCRETWALAIPAGASIHADRVPHYRADGVLLPHWRSPLCMPRWAARIILEVESVAVDSSTWDWAISFRRVVEGGAR